MANLYHNNNNNNNNNNTCTYISCPPSSSSETQDEMSLLLQQILMRSSSSSSSTGCRFKRADHFGEIQEPGEGLILLPGGTHPTLPETGVGNLSSSSVGTLDNNNNNNNNNIDPINNDYDCESEDAVDALGEEEAGKSRPNPGKGNSSKRSRAAEVHNLSEKRRRSRINEKMKALQNLIPNSNKTDKASMLDEAIEYLKQLQLQVQMLTVRNGLSLYPICLPGVPQSHQIPHLSMDISRENRPSNLNMKEISDMDQGFSGDNLLSLLGNCINQAHVADIARMIGSETSFETESATPENFGHLISSTSFKQRICREQVLHGQQMDGECSQASLMGKGYYPVAQAKASVNYDSQASNQKGNTLEAYLPGGDCLANVIINHPNISSHFSKLRGNQLMKPSRKREEESDRSYFAIANLKNFC